MRQKAEIMIMNPTEAVEWWLGATPELRAAVLLNKTEPCSVVTIEQITVLAQEILRQHSPRFAEMEQLELTQHSLSLTAASTLSCSRLVAAQPTPEALCSHASASPLAKTHTSRDSLWLAGHVQAKDFLTIVIPSMEGNASSGFHNSEFFEGPVPGRVSMEDLAGILDVGMWLLKRAASVQDPPCDDSFSQLSAIMLWRALSTQDCSGSQRYLLHCLSEGKTS